MANPKSTVYIYGLKRKSTDVYTVELSFGKEEAKVPYDISTKSQMGVNLLEGIKILGLSIGSSMSELLVPSSATLSYLDTRRIEGGIVPLQLEIPMATLTRMRDVVSMQKDQGAVASKTSGLTLVRDVLPQTLSAVTYVKGIMKTVIDGDTFDILVSECTDDLHKPTGERIQPGKTVRVRLVGVNTFETEKDEDEGRAQEKNTAWLASHGYKITDANLQLTYRAAKESKDLLAKEFANKKPITFIVDDYDTGFDKYDRLLGEALYPYEETGSIYTAISINKSLLATPCKQFPGEALAEPMFLTGKDGEIASIFSLNTWWQYAPNYEEKLKEINERKKQVAANSNGKEKFLRENGLTTDETGGIVIGNTEKEVSKANYVVKKGDDLSSIIAQFTKDNTYTTTEAIFKANGWWAEGSPMSAIGQAFRTGFYIGKTIVIPILQQFGNTYADYIEARYTTNLNNIPADCETEDYLNHIYDDRDELDGIDREELGKAILDGKDGGFTRIGDCTFMIPPLAIKIDTSTSNRKVPTLRSKSSIQTQTGHSARQITMKLFFANETQVNGIEYPNPADPKHPYYRNGLRPLIAQFKSAPFLPIENSLLNDSYGIYNIAFKDLIIGTVPGFPGCIEATLIMHEFDHSIYMPHEEYFAGTFNWKLFRWYYQRRLNPKNAELGRTYHAPITILDDSVSFYIPDEEVLAERQQAIIDLFKEIDPEIFELHNSTEDTETGKQLIDAQEMDMAKAEYEVFKNWLASHPISEYPRFYKNGVFDPDWDTSWTPLWQAPKKELAKYKKAIIDYLNANYNFETAYGKSSGVSGMATRGDAYTTEASAKSSAINMRFLPNKFDRIVDFLNIDFLLDGKTFSVRLDGNRLVLKAASDTKSTPVAVVDKAGGVFTVPLLAKENKILIKRRVGSSCAISPFDILVIKKIGDRNDDIKTGFENYAVDFDKLNYKAHMSEKDIPVVPFPIPDIHIIAMNTALSNSYAGLQLQGQECPAFQFMGSQDISVNMLIKTKSKYAVERFNDLLNTTQRLSRDYRIAITSGLLTIKNNMFDMFGVKDFLIDTISVETSPDDKESFNIYISLTAFDKTQRLKEDLESVSVGGTFDSFEQYKEYSEGRRNKEGFEYGVVDFKLKQLEIYPDLELPTYEELNRDLPYLGIKDIRNKKFMHMPNPLGARFVDPDFYIRVSESTREYVKEQLTEDTPMLYMKDSYGFEALEYGPRPDQTQMQDVEVVMSEELQNWMSSTVGEVDFGSGYAATGGSSAGSLGIINKYQSKVMNVENIERLVTDNKSELRSNLASAKNAKTYAVLDWGPFNDGIKATKDQIWAQPTDQEIMEWFNIDDVKPNMVQAQIRKAREQYLKNPDPNAVHNFIYGCVKKYFPNHPSDLQKIRDGLSCSTYMYGQNGLISAPEITQEKITNMFKAMYEYESNWKQFKKNGDTLVPLSNTSDGNFAVGIAQLNIPVVGAFKNLAEARRAAWDWRFCLERGIMVYAHYFNYIIRTSKYKNSMVKDNPLDYAVILYNWPGRDIDIMDGPTQSKYYRDFMTRFVKYGADMSYWMATPEKFVDERLMTTTTAKQELQRIQAYLAAQLQAGSNLHIDTNLVSREFMQEFLGKLVGVNFDILNYVKVFEIYDPYGEIDIRYKGETYKDGWFKKKTHEATVVAGVPIKYDHEYLRKLSQWGKGLPIVVIDHTRQFDKAKQNEANLLSWQEQLHATMDPLQAMIYGHIQRRFIEREVDCFDPFDYSRFFVMVKETAYSELLKVSQQLKANDPAAPRDWHDIKWNNIYTLMDIDNGPQSIEAAVAVKTLETTEPLLYNGSNIPEVYRSAFRDILDYDQRGRLLRAFPTFQMFIIEEGRWMAWHKLWDNFYGYNSVISIDISKDRRIAADTAVIMLSNVYHSLNTQDSEVSYGEWDYKFSDLIFGTPEDRAHVWNTIWSLPEDEIIRARAEKLNSLVLKPGARIHLRMGFGANAEALPIVFNGTITEMDAQEIVTVIAQSDGIELTNKLNVSPKDTTDPGMFGGIKEPRAMMCEMLTSKGGYFKNLINKWSQGKFFVQNPLGISHFGNAALPKSLFKWDPWEKHEEWGEAGLNIYSSAGYNTFSQWIYTEGKKEGIELGWKFAGGIVPMSKGDEPSVQLYLFDKTPWDIFQIYAHVCPDYIATVLPFEYRSTIFYGKPWWGVIDRYEYKYKWNDEMNILTREAVGAYRKALSQLRVYTSDQDIIGNTISASEDYMYTNVIGVYNEGDGAKRTMTVQVDSDIATEKQTTALVHIPIQATNWAINTFTQEKYALAAATSALRDYVKEMYQGDLIVIGDPCTKPYDTMYIADSHTDMFGTTYVKRVVHHFSAETGFVTNVSPDCISIIDDPQGVSFQTWLVSAGAGLFGTIAGVKLGKGIWRSFLKGPTADLLRRYGSGGVDFIFKHLIMAGLDDEAKKAFAEVEAKKFKELVEVLGKKKGEVNLDDLKAVHKLLQESKITAGTTKFADEAARQIGKALKPLKELYQHPTSAFSLIDDLWEKSGFLNKATLFKENKGLLKRSTSFIYRNASGLAKNAGKMGTFLTAGSARVLGGIVKNPVLRKAAGLFIVDTAVTILTAGIAERYMRYLRARQALLIIPLKYRKREFTAGLKGHAGAVYGDSPGKIDKFLAGTGMFGGALKTLYMVMDIEVPSYGSPDMDEITKNMEDE